MSTPAVEPVVTIVEPEVSPPAVVDNVNDHTPNPVTPPVVDAVPDPPTPQDGGLDELRDVVAGLATSVTALTDLVIKNSPDESPTGLPWLSRGPAVKHAWDED